MKIAVYCGSTTGDRASYMQKAYELGKWIADNGHTLVYGGSNTGLMGAVADGAIDGNGRVIGVQTNIPLIQSRKHAALTESIETATMAERKEKMMELADAYIALPGGIGTLDEITEILCLRSLGVADGPIVFYNADGYYEPMRTVLERMLASGFCTKESLERILFSGELEEIAAFLQG